LIYYLKPAPLQAKLKIN